MGKKLIDRIKLYENSLKKEIERARSKFQESKEWAENFYVHDRHAMESIDTAKFMYLETIKPVKKYQKKLYKFIDYADR